MATKQPQPVQDKDVIDVEAREQNGATSREDDISARAPLTAAVLKGVEAARNLLQDQFKASEDAIGDLEKRAKELVDTVQKSVDSVGGRVREEGKEAMSRVREEGKEAMSRVREEGKEAVGRFEALRQRIPKLPIRVDLESWLNLPVEAREEVLSALGVASERQVDKLQRSIDDLRTELSELMLSHTEAIRTELARRPRGQRPAKKKPAGAKPAADAN